MNKQEVLLDDGIRVPSTSKKRRLLSDTNILWLGIFSIPANALVGVVGLLLAVRSIDKAKESLADYAKNPDLYLASSLKKVKIGRICARIGLVIFLGLVLAIVLLAR